jgi:hypothetical protein
MVKAALACLASSVLAQDIFLAQRNESALNDWEDDWEDDVDGMLEGELDSTASRRRRRSGDCNSFKKNSDNCRTGWSPTGSGCGQCMNAGARPGVMCKGQKTGYYCHVDDPPAGSDMAFACMDWTFGSAAMQKAEASFKTRTGHDVYFGVGSYGTFSIPMNGLGACFRIKATGVAKDLIVQSINSGHDVADNQFDLQVGNGGAGKFNTCAGGSSPGHNSMFSGPYNSATWGHNYGGADHKSQCKNLPRHPAKDAAMKAAGDDLVKLCEYSFDHKVRLEGGGNPHISSIGRVQCPKELVHMTQVQRKDEPKSFEVESPLPLSLKSSVNSTTGCSNCLTRMMDCRKPSAGIKDNIQPDLMVPGKKIVQTCTSDGYTRIDVQCGCFDCYC